MTKILIIEARFYGHIGDLLLSGAQDYLKSKNAEFDVVTLPGALEIPSALSFAAASGHYDGFVVLGCVIRGETAHYDVVVNESARGVYCVALAHDLAVGNGILTVESEDQAIVRADPAQKNKGKDAAEAALTLIEVRNTYA
ncbi:MAG: 6,7-dimethyl-8-ribityllumazine synthase [Alphaproteobacteria bacterium]|nr:MAG: 6,7-dimethyl-8-ribityllumazine synthase [Alphaproteobacteria bacterium]